MLCRKNVRNVVVAMLAGAGLAFFTAPVSAEIAVLNGSFESVESPGFASDTNYVSGVMPTSWAIADGATDTADLIHPLVTPMLYATATDGTTILALEGQYNAWVPATIIQGVQQDLGTMKAGDKYTFGATLFSCSAAVSKCDYKISFYDVTEGRELASITQADFDPSALGSLQTVQASFSYTATAADQGDTMRLIMISGLTGNPFWINDTINGWANRTGIDGVTVITTVPEPSTCALLATSLIGLLAYAWRKRK